MFNASSVVGQGTHIGPIFFDVMINDLIEFISASNDLLFADDNKLFERISKVQGCVRLQAKLNSLNEWCQLNRLYLNIDKCEVMTFTRKQSGGIIFPYSINSQILKRVTSKVDLGVLYDP